MKRSKLTKEFEKGLKHFYDCIDFGKCNLDAEAIQFMNVMPGYLIISHDALLEACKKAEYELGGYLGCCSDAEKIDSFSGFVEAIKLTENAIA